MAKPVSFCTCTDTKCPYNPVNHDQGCTPCIAKNLREGEIPTCFFNKIDHPKPTGSWHYEDFAALVQAAKREAPDDAPKKLEVIINEVDSID